MWPSIIRNDQHDKQDDPLSREAPRSITEWMRGAAAASDRMKALMVDTIDNVPEHLYELILSGRATFQPGYDAQGRLIEISIVPDERIPE